MGIVMKMMTTTMNMIHRMTIAYQCLSSHFGVTLCVL